MSTLNELLEQSVADGLLLPASRENIVDLLAGAANPVFDASVAELAEGGQWSELNDRFFRKLAFGTGGLRGRSVGRVVTAAEQGGGGPNGRPEHPCTGTNAMNHFNIARATAGFAAYLKRLLAEEGVDRRPRLVFSHDTRHFSRDFAERAAELAVSLGCDAYLFDGPASTPQLSFAIRYLGADGGAMITASHNPSHDNGFKVSFRDGAQLVDPHASAVIDEVNKVDAAALAAVPEEQRGTVVTLGPEIDRAYLDCMKGLVLRPGLMSAGDNPKMVFTTLHGTGIRIIPTMLAEAGFEVATVAEQDTPDGRFPTVASPNPENAPALRLAMEQADATGADVVVGTDPDCDRVGVAARDGSGVLRLLTGNQIGSLMAYYRVKTLFDQGILNDANRERAVVIKTFVTTALQDVIAAHFGIGVVNTLTGFKYIAAKLEKYQRAIPGNLYRDYQSLPETERRSLLLEHSRFFVCGGEESYGYLGHDAVRDKDGNGAVLMIAELAAYARSQGTTLPGLFDRICREFGCFVESNHSKTFEGAEGAAMIARLADSYAANPPTAVDGSEVTSFRNFSSDVIADEEGDVVPKEKMLFVDLADGRRFAVRPSGTEPKIKYYLFGRMLPPAGRSFDEAELTTVRSGVEASLAALWAWLDADIQARLA